MAKKKRRSEEPVAPAEEAVVAEAEPVVETEATTEVEASPETETTSEAETPVEGEETAETEVDVDTLLGEDGDKPAAEPESSEEAPAEATEETPDLRYQLKQVLEAIMFASQKPLSVKEITSVLKGAAEADKENPSSHATPFAKVKEAQLRAAIEEMELDYSDSSRTYEVRESAAGWQLVTKPDFAPWLRQLFPENRSARLSAPAMETLAIIAYRQPITRADIEAVRGVAVDGVMQTLLDRGLIKIDGRAEIPGRPLLYGTTQNFMEHFGLKHLDDLPNAGELRKISLPTAEPPPAETPEALAATPEVAAEQSEPVAETAEPATEQPEHGGDFLEASAESEGESSEPAAEAVEETPEEAVAESAPEEAPVAEAETTEPAPEESAPADQEPESPAHS